MNFLVAFVPLLYYHSQDGKYNWNMVKSTSTLQSSMVLVKLFCSKIILLSHSTKHSIPSHTILLHCIYNYVYKDFNKVNENVLICFFQVSRRKNPNPISKMQIILHKHNLIKLTDVTWLWRHNLL